MSGRAGTLFVVFGGTGDLARRELVPEIARLSRRGALGPTFRLLGVSRDPELDDDAYRRWTQEAVAAAGGAGEEARSWCASCVHFQRAPGPGDYGALARRIEAIEREAGLGGDRVFYLAVPPGAFGPVVEGLGEAGLADGPGWTRLVIEKPFGRDLASARDLNAHVHRWFDESQVYRIDHFIGKETVQNLLVFRFANTVFESLWNRDRIHSVQITVAESIGIRGRGAFYEATGCLRDMVQNHLTQLLAQVAMEVPSAWNAAAVRFEKVKTLDSIAPIGRDDVVYGQYAAGRSGGEDVAAYREEDGVAPDSRVETYVALRLGIDNWRWKGVPFFLRTGKRMPRRLTQVVVTFREPPVLLFQSLDCPQVGADRLVITLQPDEGFALYVDVKRPGVPLRLESIPLGFTYEEAFGPLPGAYETLLLEVVRGDQTLFVHAGEVEASWRLYTPLLEEPPPVRLYPAGSAGPEEAAGLLARSGDRWHEP